MVKKIMLSAFEKILPRQQTAFVSKRIETAHAPVTSHVEIFEDPRDVLPIWQELLAVAPASPYQTPGFLLPWIATRGVEARIAPFFVVIRGQDGTALALFCLGLKRFGLFRAAVFLGAKDSNFNFGLFRPGYAPGIRAIKTFFREAARIKRAEGFDLMLLYNQPIAWKNWQNPLSCLTRQSSPSFAYTANLGSDAESYFATRLSKDSRKKWHKKENRLAEIGAVRYVTSHESAVARKRIIEAFFAQKIAWCKTQHIDAGFESTAMRRFVEAATQPIDGTTGLELHAIFCGERIVAVYAGQTHGPHFSGFFTSFDSNPEIAKLSPGDLLLLKLMAAKCATGVTTFDLGIGEAHYKDVICDETIPLFDAFLPITWKGHILSMCFSLGLRIKRRIKQNRKVYNIVRRISYALRL